MVNTLNNLGVVYEKQGEYEKAMEIMNIKRAELVKKLTYDGDDRVNIFDNVASNSDTD